MAANHPTGTARSADESVRVTVGLGGAIRALELTVAAFGGEVAAPADWRGRHVLRADLAGLTGGSLRLLGFVADGPRVE
jgi:hypothetical protein